MASHDCVNSTSPAHDTSALNAQQLKQEFELFLEVRQYILKCLSLNHDINNPLAGIIGFGEILMEDETLTAEQKEHLNQIMICAERIRKEVNGLSEEKASLHERVDLKQIIEILSKNKSD